jgi:thiol-disulfide isomerase/thioredoxin
MNKSIVFPFLFLFLNFLSVHSIDAQKNTKVTPPNQTSQKPATLDKPNPSVNANNNVQVQNNTFDVKNAGRLPGRYSIKVKINGFKNVPLYLADNFGDKQYMRDTCQLDANGVGVFTGEPRLQRGLYMIVFHTLEGYYELPITDDQDFYFEADTSLDESKIKITGSTENEAFAQYQKQRIGFGKERYRLENIYKEAKSKKDENQISEIKAQIDTLEKRDLVYRESFKSKNPNHLLSKFFTAFQPILIPKDLKLDSLQEYYYYRTHFWDNIDFSESGLIRAPQGLMIRKLNDYMDRVSFQDPDSLVQSVDEVLSKTLPFTEIQKYFVQHLTSKFQDRKVMCHDNVTIHIINKYYCTGKAWWYNDTAGLRKMCEDAGKAIPTMCGKTAPNLRLADTSGRYYELYQNLGKVTILFFYDPTCGHCKEVIPIVNQVYNKLKSKGVVVYAVSTENKYDEWRKMIKEKPELKGWINVCKTDRYYPWPIYKQDYNIVANPTLFVLDDKGKILGKKLDEHQLEFFIESILYEKGLIDYKPTPAPPKEKPAKKD